MRIHYLQHVPFEGLGSMEAFFKARDYPVTVTRLYDGEELPRAYAFDWLIVMGGPMGVGDEAQFPWLAAEKTFIRQAIHAGKAVLGVCLGAQLIADALGAEVRKNPYREIGWFPIERTSEASHTLLDTVLPQTFEVFHWHGDTFEIPNGGKLIASSTACRNQGYVVGDRVVAFQFHLETTQESASALIEHCGDELDDSRFVQTDFEMLADETRFERINAVMESVLTEMERVVLGE